MPARTFPAKDKLNICFAHVAYRMGQQFALRNTGINSFEVRSLDELEKRIGEADVLLVSGLWRNEFIAKAPRLAFIQSISAGLDQYSREALTTAGVRLASAQGSNERAVAEHAIALILAMARQIPQGRDNQTAGKWRGMISEIAKREDELGGKTLVIVGMGRIGSRLATIAKAFDMRVIGTKRDPSRGKGAADEVVAQDKMLSVLPQADFVALTCPLTTETTNLIDARASIRFVVSVVSGQVSATKSACGNTLSILSCATTSSAAPLPREGSRLVPITRMSNALAMVARRDPMRPMPTITSVLPPSSSSRLAISEIMPRHLPAVWLSRPCGIWRAIASISAIACSATARSLEPCALASRTPAVVSASREYWSSPALIDWMKASRGALAMNSLRHRPDTSSTSASPMRFSSSSRLRTSNELMPVLRSANCWPMR